MSRLIARSSVKHTITNSNINVSKDTVVSLDTKANMLRYIEHDGINDYTFFHTGVTDTNSIVSIQADCIFTTVINGIETTNVGQRFEYVTGNSVEIIFKSSIDGEKYTATLNIFDVE
jgi:hypothetical protein